MKRAAFLASASLASLGGIAPVGAAEIPGGTHFVETKADFDADTFARIVGRPADIRQLWEAVSFHPQILNNVKNTLNGLQFGFGYAPDRIAIAFCPHGPSSSFCYSDYIWQKYRIGEAFNLKDARGSDVRSNVFLTPGRTLTVSTDPSDKAGFLQDTSIETLQKRGVIFMTCHTAVEEQAQMLVDRGFAPSGMQAQDVANDMLTHLIAGALVVPAMVGVVAVLQAQHNYTYITLTF